MYTGAQRMRKNYTIEMHCQLATITDGKIVIDDNDISQMKRHDIAKNIGYIPSYTPLLFLILLWMPFSWEELPISA